MTAATAPDLKATVSATYRAKDSVTPSRGAFKIATHCGSGYATTAFESPSDHLNRPPQVKNRWPHELSIPREAVIRLS